MAPLDHELVTQFLSGSENAFDMLMDRYQRPVYYMVKSMIFDSEEAKDVTQQAFIKAFNNLHRLKNRKNFKGWLFTIAVNLSRDHLRRKKDHQPLESWMAFENDPRDCPERKTLSMEIKQCLKRALHGLPPRQHQVVTLRLLKGLSFREIARLLEIKEETARSSFHFGIRTLRGLLSKMGITP